jgi:hypothetical protein
MRFSLKWILAGMAYVAIVAAAYGSGLWVYADALVAFTILAIAYSALLVVFARGKRRIVASGFLLVSLRFVGWAY